MSWTGKQARLPHQAYGSRPPWWSRAGRPTETAAVVPPTHAAAVPCRRTLTRLHSLPHRLTRVRFPCLAAALPADPGAWPHPHLTVTGRPRPASCAARVDARADERRALR